MQRGVFTTRSGIIVNRKRTKQFVKTHLPPQVSFGQSSTEVKLNASKYATSRETKKTGKSGNTPAKNQCTKKDRGRGGGAQVNMKREDRPKKSIQNQEGRGEEREERKKTPLEKRKQNNLQSPNPSK